jgi:hypothetical protein
MMGMVFTEFLEMIETKHSFDVADAVLSRAGSPGEFTSVGSYPDVDFLGLVRSLSELTGKPEGDLLHEFGRHLFGRFEAGFPAFFAHHTDAFDFLAGLETRVHTEVRKLYAAARTPHFELHPPSESGRVLEYRSERGLWRFALGLLEATLERFGERSDAVVVEDLSGGAGTHVRFHIPAKP